MKYNVDERLEIGKEIYDGKHTRFTAAVQYNISQETARGYMRFYRASNALPAKNDSRTKKSARDSLETMSRDMLIEELMRERKKLEIIQRTIQG